MEMISQKEMLKEMLKGAFHLEWVTCDEKNGTGGEVIKMECVFVGGPSAKNKRKNPNHFENYTRNIRAVNGDRIITVHVDLIRRFNSKIVSL